MVKPAIPHNEKERLRNLKEYNILDSMPEEDYDDITSIASQLCHTPIALISLIDEDRQWFLSHHGLETQQTDKDFAFCAHAINNPDEIFVVDDSRNDIRFHDNPLVTGFPNVIFYMGVPLKSPEGFALGTLCVIDHEPKVLDEDQTNALKSLSRQVVKLFELRRNRELLEETKKRLEAKNIELERFAVVAAHDLKSPLKSIFGLTQLLLEKYFNILNPDVKEIITHINTSSQKLINLIAGILDHSKSEKMLKENLQQIQLDMFFKHIIHLLDHDKMYEITYPSLNLNICTNKTALEQIFINLITNGIKYNDRDRVKIDINFYEDENYYYFSINDNGRGIRKEAQHKIFDIFDVEASHDRFGNRGNGIGLATVKKLIEGLGGTIKVESELGKGALFTFSLKK